MFLCARDGCSLPLFLKSVGDRGILYHVHAEMANPTGGVTRHLRVSGRGGCAGPVTVHDGIPTGPDPRVKRQT